MTWFHPFLVDRNVEHFKKKYCRNEEGLTSDQKYSQANRMVQRETLKNLIQSMREIYKKQILKDNKEISA